MPVRVRLPDSVRFDPRKLPQTLLRTSDGKLVPVSSLAHDDARQRAVASCCARTSAAWRSSPAGSRGATWAARSPRSRQRLAELKLPVGYTYEIGGQYESQRQAFRELLMVFGIAVSAGVHDSGACSSARVTPALLILLAAPLSLGGALLLLLADRHRPERLVGDGTDPAGRAGREERHHAARLLRAVCTTQGEPFESAIAHAGRIRLRPILMTTFCTLFGLLPLALGLGAGAELQKPLALAVIGGLALSTPVTLLVVPGLYAAIKLRGRHG